MLVLRSLCLVIICNLLISPVYSKYRMGGGKVKKPVPASTSNKQSNNKNNWKEIEKKFENEMPHLKELGEGFDILTPRLLYLRNVHYGYNEIVPALIIGREAHIEVGRILQLRTAGQTWKQIASRHHVSLKKVQQESEELLKPIKEALPKEALTERPTTTGEHYHAE